MKNERRESYENRLLREKCFKLPEVGETPLLECIDKDFYYNIYSKCDFTSLYKIDRQFCGRSVLPGSVGNRKLMSRKQKMPMREFLYRFGKEESCRDYLAAQRWPDGFVCPKCGHKHGCRLSNGLYQCTHRHRQTSFTAGTVLHHSHVSLSRWFVAFYFVSQDKRGPSAVQLSHQIGVTCKTAWSMLRCIRSAMGQRDAAHLLSGVAEFEDAYFGGLTAGSKRGRDTEKARVFVALSLDGHGNLQYLKMGMTKNIKQTSVRKFANCTFAIGSTMRSDGYRSYIPALEDYAHEYKAYDPNSGMFHWLHIVVSNAKAFILETYHGLPKEHLWSYLGEFAVRFSRRAFGGLLTQRLIRAVACSGMTY